MANTGDLIYSRLSANGTVSASVGTRISPQWVQEGSALPYINYSMTSSTPINNKSGSSGQDREYWEITVFHTNYDSAKTLAAAVRTDLEGYTGTTASVAVKEIVYEGESEDADGKVFQITLDFEINRVV